MISPDSPDDLPGGAPRPLDPEVVDASVDELHRTLVRRGWIASPRITLHWLPDSDAIIAEVIRLPARVQRVVHDLLAVELDRDDHQGLPTRVCLTGVRARPNSPAAHRAAQLLGVTVWSEATELFRLDEPASVTVPLSSEVLDARLRGWRRLHGMAIGVDVLPGQLDTVLIGHDPDDVVTRVQLALSDMRPDAVVEQIATTVAALRRDHDADLAGCPLALGVQIPGPVEPQTGDVHHFRKRDRLGRSDWVWNEVPLQTLLTASTGLPTQVVNDVVGYATYERWMHPAPDEPRRAVLLISQGIGAKLIVNGRVDELMPMEIGNIVLDPEGRPCDCGKRGCVEATAGTQAILEQIHERTGQFVPTIDDAIALVDTDGSTPEQAVIDILRSAGGDLARVIGFVQAMANPSSWAVYGPYALLAKDGVAGQAFLHALFDYEQFVSFEPFQQSPIQQRPINDMEGSKGAALFALETLSADAADDPR